VHLTGRHGCPAGAFFYGPDFIQADFPTVLLDAAFSMVYRPDFNHVNFPTAMVGKRLQPGIFSYSCDNS
jgi:hypothetical protein